jgi:hypothetical protein
MEMNNLAERKDNGALRSVFRWHLLRLAEEWGDRSHPKGAAFWEKRGRDLEEEL